MFYPTYIQLQYMFYLTGNTPAVNLLRHSRAWDSKETIHILLLACGDPRNILFSLWNEGGHGELTLEIPMVSSCRLS